MGPFPHDAAPPQISAHNPMGTDGFEFVEYAHPEPEKLKALLEQMGFTAVARHRSKNVTLYRQGDVNFVVNAEPDSFAQAFAAEHGPCACAMAFRVVDANFAYQRAIDLGPSPIRARSGRWSSTSRPSRASAGRCSISSTAMATRARSGTWISSGRASATRSPSLAGSTISIT